MATEYDEHAVIKGIVKLLSTALEDLVWMVNLTGDASLEEAGNDVAQALETLGAYTGD